MKDDVPVCYRCLRPAKKGLHPFCSKRCAAEDALERRRHLVWSPKYQLWVEPQEENT